uniref:Uncharacterized protein n=1 Tax=Arundo donax TaxID=35708 RepID=A0A0A8Z3V2_ARUDO
MHQQHYLRFSKTVSETLARSRFHTFHFSSYGSLSLDTHRDFSAHGGDQLLQGFGER